MVVLHVARLGEVRGAAVFTGHRDGFFAVGQEFGDHLRTRFGAAVESRTIREEDVHFPLPLELRVV